MSAGSTEERALALDDLARYELAAGRLDAADRLATELLALAPELEGTWNHGNVIHAGHTVHGLVALRRGSLEDAKRHLLASAETSGSPQLNSFGPSMTLAHALVERGEASIVLRYLERCDRFWEHGHDLVLQWERDLRSNRTADFKWHACR